VCQLVVFESVSSFAVGEALPDWNSLCANSARLKSIATQPTAALQRDKPVVAQSCDLADVELPGVTWAV